MASVVHKPHASAVVHRHAVKTQPSSACPEMVTDSDDLELLLEHAEKVAKYDLTVLVSGESGTGKTTLARYIHHHSARGEQPLVVINCATLPRDLLESELFGHAKGAFTGAVADRPGRVEACDGGTLVLDEVGDLPLDLQPKLLMFLQDRTYYRVGCDLPRKANVRLIAATNRPLLQLCREQQFREDLYYRLSVLRLDMPALRDRPQAIAGLSRSILQRIADRTGQEPKQLTAAALQRLQANAWPGNVRELENVLERAAVFTADALIDIDSLQFDAGERGLVSTDLGQPLRSSLAGRTLRDIETQAIRETLEVCGGNRAMAAEQLGISERSVYNKLKRIRVDC